MEKSSSTNNRALALLRPGDLAFVLSHAYTTMPQGVEGKVIALKEWGLRVEQGVSVGSASGPFAGSDEIRCHDLQRALDHPEVKLILCTRGGYGITRYIDQINWAGFQANPKWVVGFSDVTAVHLAVQQQGYSSIHGPMLIHFDRADHANSVAQLKELLFGGSSLQYLLHSTSPKHTNPIDGEVVGGNLTLLVNSLGTPTELSCDGKILFLEEVGERYYRIDRMLQHLFRVGKFKNLKAIVLGQFTDCEVENFPFSLEEMVRQKVGKDVAVFTGLEVGHGAPSFPIVLGFPVGITKSSSGFIFTQNLLTSV